MKEIKNCNSYLKTCPNIPELIIIHVILFIREFGNIVRDRSLPTGVEIGIL